MEIMAISPGTTACLISRAIKEGLELRSETEGQRVMLSVPKRPDSQRPERLRRLTGPCAYGSNPGQFLGAYLTKRCESNETIEIRLLASRLAVQARAMRRHKGVPLGAAALRCPT